MSKVIGLKKINRCSKELTKIHLKKISHSQFKSREFHSHFHSYSTQIRSKNVRQGAIFKQLFFATTYPPTRTSESKRAKNWTFVRKSHFAVAVFDPEGIVERGPEDTSILPPNIYCK